MTRDDVASYLLMVLGRPGIRGEVELMVGAVERWRDTPELSFADAYLAARASAADVPVFTKNVSELRAQGVRVPVPLPAG